MSQHYTFAQLSCIKKSGLTLQKLAPLKEGDRIGVAVSGGADSLTLLKTMLIRQRIIPFRTELMALHCNPGFEPDSHLALAEWLAEQGVPSHLERDDFGLIAHSSENRKKSPCFLCAWLRRKRLFDLCLRYKLTHLALGHNADDLATTWMLNFFRNGSSRGLLAAETFFGGQLILVRPLILVEKKTIRQAARQWKLPVFANACPTDGNSARTGMESLLVDIDAKIPGARRSALAALTRSTLQEKKIERKP